MTSQPKRKGLSVTMILLGLGVAILAITILATFVVFFAYNADTITPTATLPATFSDTQAAAVTSTANAAGSLTPLSTAVVTLQSTVVNATATPGGAQVGPTHIQTAAAATGFPSAVPGNVMLSPVPTAAPTAAATGAVLVG